jgi:hypothetical protein
MARKHLAAVTLASSLFALSGLAHADPPKKTVNRVVLEEKVIYGAPQKPLAAVDVSRVKLSIPLSEPRAAFETKIAAALVDAPF